MRELIEFLNARLDDEEREAKAAQDVRSDYHAWHQVIDLREQGMDERDALHIVTHSPARVLAEVEAKRRIVDEHAGRTVASLDSGVWGQEVVVCRSCRVGDRQVVAPCPTLRLVARPYASHPDYREEWRP